MVDRPAVDAVMAAGLSDWLAGQETLRTQTLAKANSRLYFGFGAAAVAFFFLILFSAKFNLILFLCGGAVAAGFAWSEWVKRPVINAIKSEINAHVAQAMGFDYRRDASPDDSFDIAKRFEMLPSYDDEAFEDFWTGTLDGVPMRLFEAHLQEWQGSGKHRRLETVFRGPIITVQFARSFQGVTLVERDGERGGFALFGNKDQTSAGDVELERAKMVHPDFEVAFDVWTTDQAEARYIVHPAYCERLIALEQTFRGRKLRALFLSGEIIILVDTEELFESGSLDAQQDRARTEETINQFVSLAELAKALNERPRDLGLSVGAGKR